MAIHYVAGLPGGGKGLCAMIEADRETIKAERCILTNFAIEKNPWVNGKHKAMIGYSAYLRREYKKNFDMEDRIFRVSDEAAGEFFLYRALPCDVEVCAGAEKVIVADGVMTPEEFFRHVKWKLWKSNAKIQCGKDG